MSVRAGVEALFVTVEESEHAIGWNAALREVVKLLDVEDLHVAATTKAALDDLRADGKKTGGLVPYGFTAGKKTGKLQVNPVEQAVIARAQRLRARGLSLRAIAATLNGEGRLNREGNHFDPTAIRRMLAKTPVVADGT